MFERFDRKRRAPQISVAEITVPRIAIPDITMPKIERDDVVALLRRAAVYLVPAIATFAFFTLIAWFVRRQLTLPDEIQLEPVVEPIEPDYAVSA